MVIAIVAISEDEAEDLLGRIVFYASEADWTKATPKSTSAGILQNRRYYR